MILTVRLRLVPAAVQSHTWLHGVLAMALRQAQQ